MDELPTKASNNKLNIGERIILEIYRKDKNIKFKKYWKAPEYVKKDREIAFRVIKNENISFDEIIAVMRYSNINIEDCYLIEFLNKFSTKEIAQMMKEGYIDHISLFNICGIEQLGQIILEDLELIEKYNSNTYFLNNIIKYFINERKYKEIAQMIKEGFINPHLFDELFEPYQMINIIEQDFSVLEKCNPEVFKTFYEHLKFANTYQENIIELMKFIPNEEMQKMILDENPSLLNQISKEDQKRYYTAHPSVFKYLSEDIQLEYIHNEETTDRKTMLFQNASENVKRILLTENPFNIQKLPIDEQRKFALELPQLFEYLTKDVKIRFILEKLDGDELIDFVIYSGELGAIGHLTPADYNMHGTLAPGEEEEGVYGYSKEQLESIQELNIDQISKLIEIDCNYILPYMLNIKKGGVNFVRLNSGCPPVYLFTQQEKNKYLKKCEDIFERMFGKETLEKYKKSIELIFDSHINKQEIFNVYLSESNYGKELDGFLQQGEMPLENLKMLFNKNIIKNNPPSLIEQYLQADLKDKDTSDLFKEIIKNAYGEQAKEILESRPNVNIHSINSLEIFDERILGQFGEAFVHNAISYNLRDFSAFLYTIKDPLKAEDFKIYYKALSEICGENIETMQKAISEFHSVEKLFANVRNADLTERQYSNLISVICSRKNPHKISTLDELEIYDEIVINGIKDEIKKLGPDEDTDYIKNLICQQILGIDYFSYSDYGRDICFLTKLYDIQSEHNRKDMYEKEELDMLDVINFIVKEKSNEKLAEFINDIGQISKKGIQTPVVLRNALSKMISNQTKILNQSLTSIEKLDEECKKEGSGVTFREEDGIKYYDLEGIPFAFLETDICIEKKIDNEFSVSYEGQASNNAICCRLVNSQNEKDSLCGHNNHQLYFNIYPNMVIAASFGRDAGTTHTPKQVRNRGVVDTKITNISNIMRKENEVAINRFYQENNMVGNNNRGGRVMPDAYGITTNSKLDDTEKNFCRKYNIPVFVVHREKYLENDLKTENKMER